MNAQMLDLLCAIIRETGCSDSAAASRGGVHPSTVSRWKRDCVDVAILLRSAREEFRLAQLSVILAEAQAGHARSWRAAAWLLERIFPEDYSPRAKERALFQAQHDALCDREVEGSDSALPDEGAALQNVQNAGNSTAEMGRLPVSVLQNVRNSTSRGEGAFEGRGAARDGAIHVEDHVGHVGEAGGSGVEHGRREE